MTPPTILEVWHGGIPHDAPPFPRCAAADCTDPSAHSHTHRISDKPWSIPWPLYVKYHMADHAPALIVHRVAA